MQCHCSVMNKSLVKIFDASTNFISFLLNQLVIFTKVAIYSNDLVNVSHYTTPSLVRLVALVLDFSSTKLFKVVRVVDDTCLDASSGPRKCSVTLDTKHLVTSIRLEDARMTRGTWFCGAIQLFDCCYIVLVTLVLVVTLVPVTITAYVGVAQTTVEFRV